MPNQKHVGQQRVFPTVNFSFVLQRRPSSTVAHTASLTVLISHISCTSETCSTKKTSPYLRTELCNCCSTPLCYVIVLHPAVHQRLRNSGRRLVLMKMKDCTRQNLTPDSRSTCRATTGCTRSYFQHKGNSEMSRGENPGGLECRLTARQQAAVHASPQ